MNFSRNIVIATGILGLSAFLYAWQIEPFWIQTTYHQINAGLKSPVKLLVLSDLHTREFGRLEKKVLMIVNQEKPDLIVVVGDCFTPRATHQAAHRLLSSLKAPLGVWLVRGNWENWNPLSDEKTFYRSAGVSLLLNSVGNPRNDLTVIGFDDPWAGHPSIELAEKHLAGHSFRIALFHAPIFFDKVAGRYPLCIAGHTHGGQIRLPGIKPWLPGGCGRYLEGWYTQSGSRLYVTRGVGTSVLPIRFLCRPEITVITLS